MRERRLDLDDGSLVDVLDRLLDVGAYLDGTVLLTLADVDLVRLDLRLLLASVDTLRGDNSVPPAPLPAATRASDGGGAQVATRPTSVPRASIGSDPQASPPAALDQKHPRVRSAPDLEAAGTHDPRDNGAADRPDSKDGHAGLAGLVVVVVNIVRQLLERQAIRRMDAGTLTDVEVEHLGQALMALDQQVAELTEFVGAHRRDEPSLLSGPAPRHRTPRPNQKEGSR